MIIHKIFHEHTLSFIDIKFLLHFWQKMRTIEGIVGILSFPPSPRSLPWWRYVLYILAPLT